MFLRVKEMNIGMDEGLHYCKPQAPKIEHTNQNKVKCKLLVLVCFSFSCFESSYSKTLPFNWECELRKFASKIIMFQEAFQF